MRAFKGLPLGIYKITAGIMADMLDHSNVRVILEKGKFYFVDGSGGKVEIKSERLG